MTYMLFCRYDKGLSNGGNGVKISLVQVQTWRLKVKVQNISTLLFVTVYIVRCAEPPTNLTELLTVSITPYHKYDEVLEKISPAKFSCSKCHFSPFSQINRGFSGYIATLMVQFVLKLQLLGHIHVSFGIYQREIIRAE